MAVPIIFNAININGQYTNTTVSIGENAQPGWSAHSKNNFGVGTVMGINLVITPISNVLDPDVIDAPITDPDIIRNFENQQL